jgi:hypothetical protein
MKCVSARLLLKRKVARLTEAESAEVLEYIAIMRALSAEAQRPDLFAGCRALETPLLRPMRAPRRTGRDA